MALLLAVPGAFAGINVWTNSGAGDWWTPGNWSTGDVPQAADDVYITNSASANVLLTNSTPALNSLTVSNGAWLTFSNWNTRLNAATVTILPNGHVTCTGPFSYNTAMMTNRVWIACSNLTVAGGGEINVNAKGYTAVVGGAGQGPGGGEAVWGSGGGYGGAGSYADLTWGQPYGAAGAPELPGSAGGTDSAGREGGHGGGAIRIDATGSVQDDGTISANGGAGVLAYSGGGSGGGIMITCLTFNGTGYLRAWGGANGPSGGGGGGGGRIAILYSSAQSGIVPPPTVQIRLNAGAGNYGGDTSSYVGDMGTLYIPSPAILTPSLANIYGQILGFTSWSPDSLNITSTWVRLADEGLQLTVTNDINVRGSSSKLEFGPAVFEGRTHRFFEALGTNGFVVNAKNLQVDGGGTLNLFSGMSNAVDGTDWGARLSITGQVTVGNAGAGTIYSVAHSTNGSATFIHSGSLVVATNGTISSSARGYAGTYTGSSGKGDGYGAPGGAGHWTGGGAHGGAGGAGWQGYAGGSTYGSSNAPVTSGSAGGQYWEYGGFGGGAIRIDADSSASVDGTINANGSAGSGYCGGGAGGGVYITCHTLAGTDVNASISANGGAGGSSGGGGGGGRIAVWSVAKSFSGASSAKGGTSASYTPGSTGTIVWVTIPPPGTIISLR